MLEFPKCKSAPPRRTHRQASQSRQDLPGLRVHVQPGHADTGQPDRNSKRRKTATARAAGPRIVNKRAHLVNRVLRSRSDADPPPFLKPPPSVLPLLEVRQPLDQRRDPARGRVLQAHREQFVVHFELYFLGAGAGDRAIHARRGELDAGEREQRGVGFPREERDDAGRLFEREELADCVHASLGTVLGKSAWELQGGDALGLSLRALEACERKEA